MKAKINPSGPAAKSSIKKFQMEGSSGMMKEFNELPPNFPPVVLREWSRDYGSENGNDENETGNQSISPPPAMLREWSKYEEEGEHMMKNLNGHEAIAASIINELSLDERISLLSGKSMWTLNGVKVKGGQNTNKGNEYPQDLESIWLSDGPHGLRKTTKETSAFESHPATCFPTACTLACSWNVNLLEDVGIALSKECQRQNVSVLLGPGMNIKRHPCGGRNFEYFSEDPYLTGTLASAMVKGIQYDNHVGACIKHVCANNQETLRFRTNVVVDERTLREIYLRGFEHVVKQEQQPWTMMTAYNSVNGTYCSENPRLFQDIIRKEWGYNGLVMTDWGAINDRVASIKAGIDLEMPGSYGAHNNDIKMALMNGTLSHKSFHQAVTRNLCLIIKGNKILMDHRNRSQHKDQPLLHDLEVPSTAGESQKRATQTMSDHEEGQNLNEGNDQDGEEEVLIENHHKLAYRAALESIVLLRNEGNMVPLKKDCSIALIGDFCKSPRYQGMGSSKVTSYKVDTIEQEILRHTTNVQFARGYDNNCSDYDPDLAADNTNGGEQLQGPPAKDLQLIEEAVGIATKADVVLIAAGLPGIYESEAYDRKNIDMPRTHNELIQRVCEVNPNTVVLLNNGGPVSMPWNNNDFDDGKNNGKMNNTNTPKAIFEGYLMGQAGSSAFVDILFGEYSPCGKLAETFPLQLQDVPSNPNFPGDMYDVEYREGLNVGYRYYDTMNVPVLFPFGHGLSYTTFSYSDLLALPMESGEADSNNSDNKNDDSSILVEVQCRVTNTGKMPASEIIQCYVHHNCNDSMVYHPEQELKRFEKVHLQPGESKVVHFHLGSESFAFYDIGRSDWIVEKGQYDIRIGASSRDIRLQESITLTSGTTLPSPKACETHPRRRVVVDKEEGATIESPTSLELDDASFVRMMGGQDHLDKCRSPLRPAAVSFDASTASNETIATTVTEKKLFHRNSLLKETKSTYLGQILTHFVLQGAKKQTTATKEPSSSSSSSVSTTVRSESSISSSSSSRSFSKSSSSLSEDDENTRNTIEEENDNSKEQKMVQSQLLNLPLRCLVLFSEGDLSFEGLDTLIDLLNGKYCKASWYLFTSLCSTISTSFVQKVR